VNELGYSAETTEPATPAVEDDTAEFDETGLAGEYDGNLDAILAAQGHGPARQESFDATWGDDPQWPDEAGLDDEDDANPDSPTAANGQGSTRQESFDATWGDDPQWPDETSLDDEDDSNLDAEENAPAPADAQGVPAEPASPPAETAGATQDTGSDGHGTADAADPQPEHPETRLATAEPDPAPETGGQADVLTGQAGDSHSDQQGAPEASLEQLKAELRAELKAEYEASLKDVKAEVQALKDSQPTAPDAPGDTGGDTDQPRSSDRKLPEGQRNAREAEHQDDRPGLWSNAKYALYGAVGAPVTMALIDRFAPGISHVAEDIIVGVPPFIGALVPTLREGWKRKHDNPPAKH
jgi:hypothetical protein